MRRQRERHEGAFETDRHPHVGTAREVVEDRTVYGAVIVTAEEPQPPTTSAAGVLSVTRHLVKLATAGLAHGQPGRRQDR
ncbi:hypothetical protein AQJ43_19245 [Streptomyces avermitilis]|nr:hypothetical protein AQJ43_19245 [Streptomyces avermitilis]